MNKVSVTLDGHRGASYEIHIGHAIMDRIAVILSRSEWARRYFILSDTNVGPLYGDTFGDTMKTLGLRTEMMTFSAGEGAKSVENCVSITGQLADRGADRTSALIALGGGVVGDVTGFIASIFMRGIPHIQIPTTLLAMVDSSIGGKTGIDTHAAKNLLGTFWQPRAVFVDVGFLKTLPEREFANGLAEIIKYGIIEDPQILGVIAGEAKALNDRDPVLLERLIEKSCTIKRGLVEIDETDKGLRRILNFGHTLGHALEAESRYALAHGEAIAIGMVAAAVLSERMNYLASSERETIVSVIRNAGLPERIPSYVDTEGIMARLKHDKKKEGERIHFVLLKRLGAPFVNAGVPERIIRETLESMTG